MSQRFVIYLEDTLEKLIEALNAHPDYCGRIVYMEKGVSGYRAVLDEWALVTNDISNIEDDDMDEAERRTHNQIMLKNMDLDTSNTV